MLDALFILLAQAAAGPPAEVQDQAPATQQAEQAAPADQTTAEEDRNRRRCRIETVTGSRMGARVCRTQNEEDADSVEARRLLENSMRMWDNQSSGGGGG